MIAGMPRSALESAVRAVDWHQLRSTYESGEIVRDIVLGVASREETEVRRAWQQINETVLQHQGTVYPATAAAAPFLCQIALDEATPWQAALTAELAFLSAGYDEPYAPAGRARAVRDAVRSYVGQLLRLWGSADAELALGYHGHADEAVERIILDEVGEAKATRALRRRRSPTCARLSRWCWTKTGSPSSSPAPWTSRLPDRPGLPAIPGDELIRALQAAGFRVIRTRGSHRRLKHPDGRATTVPVHAGRDVPKGTLRAVLRDVGLTADDLRQLLR